MERQFFPSEVTDKLKWYVYRLIDPRNGETFYVGKGRGNRIFEHVKGALAPTQNEDTVSLKFRRIRDIAAAGLSVSQVVHRHGIESESLAYEVEAALIDAYPGLTNLVAGHESSILGCRHVEEIISVYAAEPFVAAEPLILISIGQSYNDEETSIYEAVRGHWRASKSRAENFRLVLAHVRGMVIGAFRPTKWLTATKENFPTLAEDLPDRIGFVGLPAEEGVSRLYVGKRVPDAFRPRGAANPVRFVSVGEAQVGPSLINN